MLIRRLAEDFAVTEHLADDFAMALEPVGSPNAQARFAIFRIRKTSVTTPDACAAISRELRCSSDNISYGGLKDRHAVCVQHVSVKLDGAGVMTVRDRRLPTKLDIELGELTRVQARLIGTSAQPMTAKDIKHNSFVIVIRRCNDENLANMAQRAELLAGAITGPAAAATGRELVFTNAFGTQRFGSNRHGAGWVAEAIAAGDYERALKLSIGTPSRKDSGAMRNLLRDAAERWGQWSTLARLHGTLAEGSPFVALAAGKDFAQAYGTLPRFLRHLHLDAYASLQWNQLVLARLEKLSAGSDSGPHFVRADDDFGPIIMPTAQGWREHAELAALRSWAPLVPEAVAAGGGTAKAEIDGEFAFGRPRAAFAVASGFVMADPVADAVEGPRFAQLAVSFNLRPGSFATVLLRGLGQS